MTKNAFVRRLAKRVDATIEDTGIFVDGFVEEIEEALKDGETVLISGFGTFATSHRGAHKGTHPQNKDVEIEVPAYEMPVFRVSPLFKDYVNGEFDKDYEED